MNILFFITPKSEVSYLCEDDTLRQALEKMELHKYSCVPLLGRDGRYVGTISEGDFLWGLKIMGFPEIPMTENIPISNLSRRSNYRPVRVNANMEDLFDRAINQNYVPVVDDDDSFIGIITRKEILKYCYNQLN